MKAHSTIANISAQLESRVLLSATTSYDAATHELTVSCTGSESLSLASDANQNVTLNGFAIQDAGVNIQSTEVRSIRVNGGGGDNKINLSGVKKSAFPVCESVIIKGGSGNDTIRGSDCDDTILGGDGDDKLWAALAMTHMCLRQRQQQKQIRLLKAGTQEVTLCHSPH